MISEEKYQAFLEEIKTIERKNPLIVALNLLCPHNINVGDLEKKLKSANVNVENAVHYFNMKNLLALHDCKNSGDDERERYSKEVQRIHLIVSYLERDL